MTVDRIAQLAKAFAGAYRTGVPIEPPTETSPGLSIEDAYQIQVAQVAAWQDEGRTIRGHKVGLTARAMQEALGIDQPDFGHLTADMFHHEGEPISLEAFIAPRIEPEVAFVLGQDLEGPGLHIADVAAAVVSARPSLEIIDSRVVDWRIRIEDTIADNASSGGVVLGAAERDPADLDLVTLGCNLRHRGRVVETGTTGAVLGNPLNALRWLANTLGERGVGLRAGHVVLPGSCTAAVPIRPGDVVVAEFATLGSVTARFASP